MTPSTAELTEQRLAAVALLPSTCTIISVTEEDDGMGGTIDTEVESATLACRVATLSRSEIMRAARITPVPTCSIRLPWNTGVLENQKIKIGSRIFSVTYVQTSDWGVYTSAWCTEDK